MLQGPAQASPPSTENVAQQLARPRDEPRIFFAVVHFSLDGFLPRSCRRERGGERSGVWARASLPADAGAQPGGRKVAMAGRAPTGAFCPFRRVEKRVLMDRYGIDLRARSRP